VQPAIIQSRGPATKLAKAFRDGAALTVETWIAPGNLTQKGPAKIASFASGRSTFVLRGSKENVMLGQEGVDGIFRLRTLLSGRGGSTEILQTREGLTRQPSHLVATYTRGIERLFVNGQQTAMLDITKDVIIAFGVRKTAITQIAYIVFYFLPVSVFLSAFLSVRVPGSIKVLLIVVAGVTFMVALTEIFQASWFNRAVDYPILAYAVITSAAGYLTGARVLPTRIVKQAKLACLPGDG
jgi:hypothetical protein